MGKLTKLFRTPFLDIKGYEFDLETIKLIPESVAREHKIIAIEDFGKILTLGMVYPENTTLIEFLEQEIKKKVIPFLITLSDWEEIISTVYINEKEINYIG